MIKPQDIYSTWQSQAGVMWRHVQYYKQQKWDLVSTCLKHDTNDHGTYASMWKESAHSLQLTVYFAEFFDDALFCFSVSFHWYTFLNFCMQISRPLAYGVHISLMLARLLSKSSLSFFWSQHSIHVDQCYVVGFPFSWWTHWPFHSWDWSMSNFPSSPTRNITSHSKENLALHSLLRWKMIALPILTTSPIHFSLGRLGECTFWAQEWPH